MADHYHQRQSNIDEIKRFTVGITRSADSGSTLGTGVIVTEDGLIVTCYHVISDLYKKIISNTFYISFPAQPGIRLPAQVLNEFCNSSLDIAFLQIQEKKLPQEAAIANLNESAAIEDHKFKSYGFRRQTILKNGLYSPEGTIEGKLPKNFPKDTDIALPEVIQLTSDGIDHGMSGAAVLDKNINRVVGIVSEHLATSGNVDKNFALAIPVHSIIEVCSILKEKNDGLKPISEFLRKTELPDSIWYRRIDELFVPPVEYSKIKSALEKDKIVFITGSPEYGKTYTAIRLLWEYFSNEGYEPKYIHGKDKEGIPAKDKLKGIESQLKPGHFICFDDPFGEIEYESDKELERNIVSIIDTIHNTEDTYVIVTSGEEVFKEFINKANADEKEIKKFEIKLNLGTRSYTHGKRKEMLLKYAQVWNCTWLNNEDLKNMVLVSINKETNLPTPLNIKDFINATKTSETEEEILTKMNAKSQQTARSFANDIIEMQERGEKNFVLFLCFPFISDGFSPDFVKTEYKKLLKDFNIKDDGYAFERAHTKFQDKIEFSHYIRFSHPSYSQALPFLLLEDGIPTEINTEIFSKILLKLANNKHAATDVAMTVAYTFDKLTENVQNLLLKLVDNKDVNAGVVAFAVVHNFDNLPENVRNELLLKIADNTDAAGSVAYAVAHNFDKLPENMRNELLTKLADNKHVATNVAYAVAHNFDKLPENMRNELLTKLIKLGVFYVADAVASDYVNLPENVQNLLFKLAENKDLNSHLAEYVDSFFDELSENVRNRLLLKIADNTDAAGYVAIAVAHNFDKLPENVQDLLFKLAENKDTAKGVAYAVARYFDKLPLDITNELLLKLVDREYATRSIAYIIASNFDKLPENVQNFLFKLVDNNDKAVSLAWPVASNFDKLPENQRVWSVSYAVANNFDKLPENVQNLLFKLADNKDTAGEVASAVAHYFDKLPENARNGLLLKLADNKYVSENTRNELQKRLAKHGYDKESDGDAAYAVAANFEKLPKNVQNLLFKLADNKDTAILVAEAIEDNFEKLPENVRNDLQKRLAKHGYNIG